MKDVNKKYLIQPFDELVNSKGFINTKNTQHIIVGTTGLGKTYTCFMNFFPILFNKHDLDLIIFTYPNTEVFESVLAHKTVGLSDNVAFTSDVDEALELLNDGMKVLLCTTHQAFSVSERGKQFNNTIEAMGISLGVFADEAHTWLTSSPDNYGEVIGSTNPLYNASLYKVLARISQRTPYVFGITATPNAEQTNLIGVSESMKFKIINDFPSLDDIISRCAWLNGVTNFDIHDENQVYETFGKAIYRHAEKSNVYGKQTMLITAGRGNDKRGWDIKYVLEMLKFCLNDNGYDGDDFTIGVLTSEFKGMINGNGGEIPCKEEVVKRNLQNQNHSCTFLVVIEKGKVGMSIHNLTSYFSFRPRNPKNSKGDSITESPIQIIGRLHRIFTGVKNTEFVTKWGYDLTEYVKSLNDEQIQKLLVFNSYDLYLPDTAMWGEAVGLVKEYYSPTTSNAKAWIQNIRNN